MKALKKVPGDKKGLSKLPTAVRNKMGYMKKGGKVYKTGGKAPVDPPKTSPESKSEYNIGNMTFKGEEADRLIAFNEHLDKDFSNLDLFQKTEQIEKFINSKGHKSNEAMKAYNVDPAVKDLKAPSIEDSFESAFGESSFGDSDPFADDPDIQRMREEAAARGNKKGRQRRKFKSGGAVIKNYNKGGKVKGKGMSTAERKKQYMDSVKEKQEKEKAELRKKNSSKLATSYGSTRVISPSLEETINFVSGALDNIDARREEKKYKPAREAASKRFDEATKYDELLGRSTNPNKKYKKGGKVFKPHNMYKDGKVVKAKTMADHLRLKKKGYSHKKG